MCDAAVTKAESVGLTRRSSPDSWEIQDKALNKTSPAKGQQDV